MSVVKENKRVPETEKKKESEGERQRRHINMYLLLYFPDCKLHHQKMVGRGM